MKPDLRIALVVSHPIQHFCPQYVSFSRQEGINLKVFFGSTLGYKPYHDSNFQQLISWDNLRLTEFNHEFLNGDQVLQADKNLDASNAETALDNFQPDVVIIYGYFQRLQRRVYRWAKRRKIKIAYIADTELRQSRNKFKEMIKFPLLRYFFSNIDYALTVGDANEEFYRYAGMKPWQLIRMHFPIDMELYKGMFEKKELLRRLIRDQYNIRDADFVACVVGKLVYWKNQGNIIDAMKLLEDSSTTVHLFIIGSGEMMNTLKEKASSLKSSKVYFTGFVNPEQLPSYYAASDVYIHPAAIEPHSLAISEAIYMGCPVIISDRCGSYGPGDDVQEGKNGMVFKCGDVTALVEKIFRIKNDCRQKEKYGEYSHALAEKFQEQSHIGVLKELRQKILNEKEA